MLRSCTWKKSVKLFAALSLAVMTLPACFVHKGATGVVARKPPLATDEEIADFEQLPDRPGVRYCDRLIVWAFENADD